MQQPLQEVQNRPYQQQLPQHKQVRQCQVHLDMLSVLSLSSMNAQPECDKQQSWAQGAALSSAESVLHSTTTSLGMTQQWQYLCLLLKCLIPTLPHLET
jgi:hypothetical protein